MANQNFDLIWGQNSPLAPYAFSDADYREGWNFVGSTPPARTMFDAVQQENDLKAQNLNRRLVAMEGGETPRDREPVTEYAVGDFATTPVLPTGYYLQCVVAGTTSAGVVAVADPYVGNVVPDGSVKWVILCWPTKEKILARSTAYAIGDIVESQGKRLVCVKDGTTSNENVSFAGKVEGSLIADGTSYWQVDSLADGHYDAPYQNGIYRGADITEYWDSGYMNANIRAGKFVGIHIGDIIVKSVDLPAITYTDKAGNTVTQEAQTFANVKWLVAGLDVHLHCGWNESADLAYDGETQAHHALLIPSSTLQRNVKMNPTNDTEGGYLGSDMWRVHIKNWENAIRNAFGAGHVLKHYEILSNAVDKTAPSGAGAGWAGSASSGVWTEVEVNIPNEAMVYGGRVAGSFYDVGDFPRQLPLYALKRNHLNDRSWFWLRAVASVSYFAYAAGTGLAYARGASSSTGYGGIRPYFLAY